MQQLQRENGSAPGKRSFQGACDKQRTDRNPVVIRRELENPDDSGKMNWQAGRQQGLLQATQMEVLNEDGISRSAWLS